MNAPFYIAHRFLWAHRGYLFARFLTGMAIAGVGLGVFAMALVLSVMGGFRTHLERKLLGFAPHIVVTPRAPDTEWTARIQAVIDRAALHATVIPSIEGEVILQRPSDRGMSDQGVKVRGIDPINLSLWRSVTFYNPIPTLVTDGMPGVLLGSELLLNLAVDPDAGETIRLIAPLGQVTPMGELAPLIREYRVTGWLRTGFYEHDTKLVVMRIVEAQRLLGEQGKSTWALYLEDPLRAEAVAAVVRRAVGEQATVQTWQAQNQKLFGALRLERIVMTLLLCLIILIASLSICGVVMMQVAWRRRDFAMLAAVGASRAMLRRTVIHLGTWIGSLGSALGLAAAVGVGSFLHRHPIRLPASFYLDHLPVELHTGHCLLIGIFGVMLAVIAASWPAYRASRTQPIEDLRYE